MPPSFSLFYVTALHFFSLPFFLFLSPAMYLLSLPFFFFYCTASYVHYFVFILLFSHNTALHAILTTMSRPVLCTVFLFAVLSEHYIRLKLRGHAFLLTLLDVREMCLITHLSQPYLHPKTSSLAITPSYLALLSPSLHHINPLLLRILFLLLFLFLFYQNNLLSGTSHGKRCMPLQHQQM